MSLNLNAEQQRALDLIAGPILIIAGAGSGKTRVLTERIKRLIEEHGIAPNRIMAVTFTNKAAQEMKSRLPQEYHYPWIGTFHGLCFKILNIELSEKFVIFDGQDQKELVKNICKKLDIDLKAGSVLEAISRAKNLLLKADDYLKQATTWYEEKIAKIFTAYEEALLRSQAFDFDDLLNKTIELFKNQPEILNKYQELFAFIHVDEYQDTNHAQYLLSQMLANKHHNICVVGDADQNIYSWRGANINNILSFAKDFPNTRTIKLEQNYRSTKNILAVANHIIKVNNQRLEKNLWTENEVGNPIYIYFASNEAEEANFLATEAENLTDKNAMLVLYRTNAQSRTIEDIFIRRQIPYRIVGGLKFYLRKEVKDVLAYLRYLYNRSDEVALRRINKLPGFKRFALFTEGEINLSDPTVMLKQILEVTRYQEKLILKGTSEDLSRSENIDELISAASEFANITDFLVYTALVMDIDSLEEKGNAVTLMTMHSAKGLEYDCVYLAGCEEGFIPHSRSRENPLELEEERRLMYVAITRARKKVTMISSAKRFIHGQQVYTLPSRFLDDIPTELTEVLQQKTNKSSPKDFSLKNNKVIKISVGEEIIHNQFGLGRVEEINGDIIIVNFNSHKKILSLSYAPIQKA